MKRAMSEDISVLGATELSATLNGDNPVAIFQCLRRFVKIVRRERRLALMRTDGDDDGSQNDDKEEEDDDEYDDGSENSESQLKELESGHGLEEQHVAKKYKKMEAWKEDTAAYNVPFVGTSVAVVKDTGVVVKGQWPTGLLRAYLTKSPRAVEFTSDTLVPGSESSRVHKTLLRHKKGRLSRSIYKLYLRALRELITAAIPISLLIGEKSFDLDAPNKHKEEAEVVDSCWTTFVKEIVKSRLAGLWSLIREETGNGKGKVGTKGGCGQLASVALQLAVNLAKTSNETARSVVRMFEQQHSSESIWRFLFRPQIPLEGTRREHARSAALELTAVLASTLDPVVLSAICTPGVRDRRISPGLLYMALKELCFIPNTDTEEHVGEYEKSVLAQSQVLLATRRILVQSTTVKVSLSDLFSRDVVQAIGKLALHAPSLSEHRSYESVLTRSDGYPDVSNRGDAVEARRFLFLLLEHGTDGKDRHRGFRLNEALCVKSLTQLITGSGGLQIHKFVLYCLNSNPFLLLPFLQTFVPGNQPSGFSFLANLNFLSKVIRGGPEPRLTRGSIMLTPEEFAFQLFPLKRPMVLKSLASSNGMVVSLLLHTISFSLRRFSELRSNLPADVSSQVEDYLANQLPDIPALIRLLARLEVDEQRPNSYLLASVYQLLLDYISFLPKLLSESKFDPSKILPSNQANFARLSTLAQRKLLVAFRKLSEYKNDTHHPSSGHLKAVLEILLRTKRDHVYREARLAAIALLSSLVGNGESRDADENDCRAFEMSLWVDGITQPILEEFCGQMSGAISMPVAGMLELIRAWQHVRKDASVVPGLYVSPVLIHAMKEIENISTQLQRLTFQVALNCLLFQTDPRGLASLLVYYMGSIKNASGKILKKYANTILTPYSQSPEPPLKILLESVKLLVSERSSLVHILEGYNVPFSAANSQQMMRFFSHLALVSGMNCEVGRRYIRCFRKCAVGAVMNSPLSESSIHYVEEANRLLFGSSTFIDFLLALSRQSVDSSEIANCNWTSTFWSGTRSEREPVIILLLLTPLVPLKILCHQFALMVKRLALDKKGKERDFIAAAAFSQASIITKRIDEVRCDKVDAQMMCLALRCLDYSEDPEILASLHFILSRLMADSPPIATAILNEMKESPARLSLTRAIELEEMRPSSGLALVKQFVTSDFTYYGSAFIGIFINAIKGVPVLDLLHHGKFDEIFVLLLRQELEVVDGKPFVERLVEECASRLKSGRLIQEGMKILQCIMLNKIANKLGKDTLFTVSNCIQLLCEHGVDSWNLEPIATLDLFDCFVLLSQEALPEVSAIDDRQIILAIAKVTGKDLKQSKFSATSRASELTEKFICIVGRLNEMKTTLLQEHDDAISSLVRRCLKLGLSPVHSPPELNVRVSALRLLRVLILKCRGNDEMEGDHRQGQTSFPALVLNMTVSHSNCTNVVASADGLSLRQRHEALKLILACFVASHTCRLENENAAVLQASYGASMNLSDIISSRILYLNDLRLGGKFYLDDVLWEDAPAQNRHNNQTGNEWDWLPSSLKQSRVFATLRCFPIDDDLVATSQYQTEDLISLYGEYEEERDERYSPSFIFPLILASLEAAILERSTTHINEMEVETTAAQFAQRLCNVGCLALCLAGLCSNGSSVRKISFSILFLFTKICQSQAAMELSSWHERPQICLLLDSVQRAIAIQRADPDRSNAVDSETLPRVNPLAAIFLARASMILARPGDMMYPAINRYFLRTQGEHGAFPDLNRPPAFMTLFCTSTEDPKITETERLWALEILRDSFLEERCWRPLLACHAPELLLSTISMRIAGDDDKDGPYASMYSREVELALSILLRILVFGDSRVKHTLLTSLGLLPWFSGVLVGRPLGMLKRNKGCTMLFLRLLVEALQSAFEIRENDSVQILPGFLGIACELWNSVAQGSEIWSYAAEGQGSESVSITLTRLLALLNELPQASLIGSLTSPLLNDLLSKIVWRDEKHRMDTLVALASLPFSPGDSEKDVAAAISLVRFTVNSKPPENAISVVLRRVKQIVDVQPEVFSESDEFLQELHLIRPLACKHASNKLTWQAINYSMGTMAKSSSDEANSYNEIEQHEKSIVAQIPIFTEDEARQQQIFARNVPHTVGLWAGHVYLDLEFSNTSSHGGRDKGDEDISMSSSSSCEDDDGTELAEIQQDWIGQLREHLQSQNLPIRALIQHDRWHVSLSKTFYLQQYNIDSFVESLRKALEDLTWLTLRVQGDQPPLVLTNASDLFPMDKKKQKDDASSIECRTFWCCRVHPPLLDLVATVDGVLKAWDLPQFYSPPIFHTSWASAPGDWSQATASSSMRFSTTACPVFTVKYVTCRIGDKEFRLPLSGGM